MIAEFAVWPIGAGVSTSEHVAKVIKIVHESGLNYKLNAMGTVIEGEWRPVMDLIEKCHRVIADDADRVITTVTIDDRKGYTDRINRKIESVERILGMEVKK